MGDRIIIAVEKEDIQRRDVSDVWRCALSVEEILLAKGFVAQVLDIKKSDFRNLGSLKKRIEQCQPRCVFNLFEGFSDDAGKEVEFVQALEALGIAYTGNSSKTLQACLNKQHAKDILTRHNLPVPIGCTVQNLKDLDGWNLIFPLFIKPCSEDASVGIDSTSLVVTKQELVEVVRNKLKLFPTGLIIEEFISGKEYSSGFIGNDPFEFLGSSVIDYSWQTQLSPFLTYDSKWNVDSQEYKMIMPSLKEVIPQMTKDMIFKLSLDAAKALKCEGYFRIDLRERNGQLFILDVNPNPDITSDSGFAKEALSCGYTYECMITKIIDLALTLRNAVAR